MATPDNRRIERLDPRQSSQSFELDRDPPFLGTVRDELDHTADQIASDNWNRPYGREQAAFPAKSLHDYKFWPHVSRVDNVFGDRNPVCSCAGMENYS